MSLGEARTCRVAVAPSLYVLNANSLAKPHAVAHLTRDVLRYCVDLAVITETHLTAGRHSDRNFAIPGYQLLRRDRNDRPGGGVAVYAHRQVPVTSSTTITRTKSIATCVDAETAAINPVNHALLSVSSFCRTVPARYALLHKWRTLMP